MKKWRKYYVTYAPADRYDNVKPIPLREWFDLFLQFMIGVGRKY